MHHNRMQTNQNAEHSVHIQAQTRITRKAICETDTKTLPQRTKNQEIFIALPIPHII